MRGLGSSVILYSCFLQQLFVGFGAVEIVCSVTEVSYLFRISLFQLVIEAL